MAVALGALAVVAPVLVVVPGTSRAEGATPRASGYPSASVTLSGHGWGHGIGMGQWGALGYAIGQDAGDGNSTYQQIVAHYYGGTTLVDTPPSGDSVDVGIALTENDGNSVIATSPAGVTVPGTSSTAPAVELTQDGGAWDVATGPGCAGPWTPGPTALTTPITGAADGGTIELCQDGGNLTVHGTLEALYNSLGQARTVNTLPLEQYVADTVPGESPSSWGSLGGAGPQGQDWGFQELEAQAVAVRSYVLSTYPTGYGGYAATCDLTCQDYRGTAYENPLTDLAAADTAGEVMVTPGGQVAVTEYSASTGGYTTGDQFPAVPDDGDAVCVPGACNPNHDWQASIPVTTVEAQFPQIGTLRAVTVTRRNGFGAFGGRVESMVLSGTSGLVTVTGDEFEADFGLNSDWFNVTSSPSGGVGGYWLTAADGGIFSFGTARFYGSMGGQPLNRPVVGLAPAAGAAGYWEVASDGGLFSFGTARFYGSMGGQPLNQPIVGMAATPDHGGYWEVAADGGIFSFGDARFYGSTGAMTLNRPIVGMAATPDGHGYWLVAADGGIFSFGDARFYGSTGAITLAEPVVGMAATPNGQGYWLVAADGGVFTFGDAAFEGSAAGTPTGAGSVAIVPASTGQGYLTVTAHGQVSQFGDAPNFGDLTTALSSYSGQVVGAAVTPG